MAPDRWQQTDLHVATSTAQAEDGIGAGLLAAHRVNGDVAAALGEVGDSGCDVRAVGPQGVLGAEVGGSVEGLPVAVHRNDAAPQRPGDHDRTEPNPAGTHDGDPLSLDDPGTAG